MREIKLTTYKWVAFCISIGVHRPNKRNIFHTFTWFEYGCDWHGIHLVWIDFRLITTAHIRIIHLNMISMAKFFVCFFFSLSIVQSNAIYIISCPFQKFKLLFIQIEMIHLNLVSTSANLSLFLPHQHFARKTKLHFVKKPLINFIDLSLLCLSPGQQLIRSDRMSHNIFNWQIVPQLF